MAVLNVGVLISGRGSNLQALIDATKDPSFPARIVCVVSNKADAPGLAKAHQANIPSFVVSHRDHKDKRSFEQAIDEKMREHKVQLICLAGFMRLLSPWIVAEWQDRLVNIHPSLLPAFPGLDTHKKALEYGVKLTGCTVHFVRTEMDHGPIIVQAAVPIAPHDTEESLAARVLDAEHLIYPQAVRMIAEGHVNVIEEKTFASWGKVPAAPLINPASSDP